jgi:hypothetical protein
VLAATIDALSDCARPAPPTPRLEREGLRLKCRLYRTPAGLRVAPPDEWILDPLTRTLA